MTVAVERRDEELVIRELREDEVPAAVSLVGDSLGQGAIPRTEAFWRWKHEQNPFGRSPTLVAEANGELIGLRAFLRWTWRRGTASRSSSTTSHPCHANRPSQPSKSQRIF